MIHDELVSFETAKLAKEKGFNIHCTPFYALDNFTAEYVDDAGDFYEVDFEKGDLYLNYPIKGSLHKAKMLPTPTQSLLQRWLREEKKIVVVVDWFEVGKKYFWVAKDMNNHDVFKPKTTKCMTFYYTWEQALESGLKYALKELE